MELKTTGERLSYIFESLGLSIDEVSEKLGVSTALFEQSIRNKFAVRKVTALALQAEYNINHKWLLFGEEPELIHSELDEEDTLLVRLFGNLTKKDRENILNLLKSLNGVI